jgi:hypothetical protein
MNSEYIKGANSLSRGGETGQDMTHQQEISETPVGRWYTQTQSEVELISSMQQTKRRGESIRLNESEEQVVADIWRRKPSNKDLANHLLVAACIRAL